MEKESINRHVKPKFESDRSCSVFVSESAKQWMVHKHKRKRTTHTKTNATQTHTQKQQTHKHSDL